MSCRAFRIIFQYMNMNRVISGGLEQHPAQLATSEDTDLRNFWRNFHAAKIEAGRQGRSRIFFFYRFAG